MGEAHHIRGQLVTRQVLDILVVRVDDLRELAPVHHLLKHPHVDGGDKPVVFGGVGSHDLGNGRAPVEGEALIRVPASAVGTFCCELSSNFLIYC